METNSKTVSIYPPGFDIDSDDEVLSTGQVSWSKCDWTDDEVWELDLVVLNDDLVSEAFYLHNDDLGLWLECTTVDGQQLWTLEVPDPDAWGTDRRLRRALTWASRGLTVGQAAFR